MSGIESIVDTASEVDEVEAAEVFYDLLPIAPRDEIEIQITEPG
jgi:hypothetical protein